VYAYTCYINVHVSTVSVYTCYACASVNVYTCITHTREESGERVTSQNLSRIKFESRGPDSRQSFREWSKALECRLTALTSATPISSATPGFSTGKDTGSFTLSLVSLFFSLSLSFPPRSSNGSSSSRSASSRTTSCNTVPCTRAMSPLERIPYDATEETAARLFSRGREKSATTHSHHL